jgi:hypothetical protein
MAKDVIREAVKNALIKDGWTITADPYIITYGDDKLYVDLAAERALAAERDGHKIAVFAAGGKYRYPGGGTMDRLTEYRRLVKSLLSEFAAYVNRPPPPNHETVCVFDEERDQYALLSVSWGQYRCVHGAQVFVRLRDGKIWIEEDWTEDGVATKLLEHGVPKDDIVLAFHPPEMRPFTEFAVV